MKDLSLHFQREPVSLTTGLILGGAALLGSGANAYATGKMNKKNREFANDEREKQNDWNLAMYERGNEDSIKAWHMQNEYAQQMWHQQNAYNEGRWNIENQYNSPAAQMQRYKEAGLNPNLIYGQSNMGGSVSTANLEQAPLRLKDSPTSAQANWRGQAPQFDFLSGVQAIYDQQEQAARTNNLEAQQEVIKQDAALRAAQVAQQGLQNTKSQTELNTYSDLLNTSLDAAKANLRKIKTETDISLNRDEREAAMSSSNLQEAAARIQLMRGQEANLKLDKELKELDLNLKRLGIQPHDDMWMRALGQYLMQGKQNQGGGTFLPDGSWHRNSVYKPNN